MQHGILERSIENLPATSSVTIRKLKSLDIDSYFDLLNYFPSRYENYSLITKIDKIQIGETVTVTGKIIEAKNQYTRSRITIQKIIVRDDTGLIEVNWFNQPFLIRLFKVGEIISISGLVKQFGSKLVVEPKEYEIGKKGIHTGRLVPIYSEKKGLSSRTIREKMHAICSIESVDFRVVETLPKEIISFNNLISESSAYQQIHFPDSFDAAKQAQQRLAFDELFAIQLANNLVKKEWQKERVGNMFKVETRHATSLQQFIDGLPFKLTNDQNKVVREIVSDLKKSVPMNRFLQGDVGSGKTAVAAIACYLAFLNGYQSIIMAPTEILANQHFQTIKNFFLRLATLRVGLITGSTKKTNVRNKNFCSLPEKYDIIIGTHALLGEKIKFSKVGLVVIDEQHRFGVNQRAFLREKSLNSHLLTMTATPIPRTVALTLFGELDLSYLEEMPHGRLKIKTFLIPKVKRDDCYNWIRKQIKEKKAQVFIICPLIEESASESLKSIKAVKIEFENLKNIFPEFKLSLLHGKIKSQEKNQIMFDLKNKKIDILVSTSIVEVGIDIPGATTIIIEGAERFGLAQLHQLRGRIGRSNMQSYCFLFSESTAEKINSRLEFFSKNSSGIKLAEYDLKNRGAGNIFGTEQHGFISLKIASLTDYVLINKTKRAVKYFTDRYNINSWPELKKGLKRFDRLNKDSLN